MTQDPVTPGEIVDISRKGWNYTHLLCALLVAIIVQGMVLPCLCAVGATKTNIALMFDALVVIRIIVARVMRQTDRGWIFYTILIYSSPAWIELGSRVVLGRH